MGSNILKVTIPPQSNFYSLYSDGIFLSKKYIEETSETHLYYDNEAAIFLYYTFPTHRRVYLIRNSYSNANTKLPGLSKKVGIIFKQFASRVDKTKRAVSYLNEHYKNAYGFSDSFYFRLGALIHRPGKIEYHAIDKVLKILNIDLKK